MTDSKALRCWIAKKGLKLKAIASAIGITPYCLKKKIDNESEFKASEISVFVDVFHMTREDRDAIFFASDVD